MIGMMGALFGSRFPDIDSPSSIPARRHPIIQKIFVAFGVKHRGKFSHDFASIGIFFGVIYFIIKNLGNKFIQLVATTDSTMVYSIAYMVIILVVYLVGIEVVSELQDFANFIGNKKMWAILDSRKYFFSLFTVFWLMVVLILSGVFDFNALINGNIGRDNAIWVASTTTSLLQTFVLFSLAGAYSHLFADMTTKSGVSIFWIKLAPAQVILKVRNVPLVGKILVPTEFKTGSKWEDFNRMVVSILIIPSTILATLVIFGFDISEIWEMFKR